MSITSASFRATITRDPKVIPLFDSESISYFGVDDIADALFRDSRFEQKLKEYMEIFIYSNYLSLLHGLILKEDDPFDSIYIADLKPDQIQNLPKEGLSIFQHKIEDRSSEIFFDDGLDD